MVKNNLHIVMALNNTKASEVAEKTVYPNLPFLNLLMQNRY